VGLQILLTFSLVCLGWVFFRANNVTDALVVLGNMRDLDLGFYAGAIEARNWNQLLKPFIFDGGLSQIDFLFSLFLILSLLILEALHAKKDLFSLMDNLPLPLRWALYPTALFVILLFSADAGTQNFIYFQF